MNIAVLILLGLALVLQGIALFTVGKQVLIPDKKNPGVFDSGVMRSGYICGLAGLILATLGSGLSLWAPGFD